MQDQDILAKLNRLKSPGPAPQYVERSEAPYGDIPFAIVIVILRNRDIARRAPS